MHLSKGGIHLILCLALLVFFRTAISVGPVLPILYFIDQVLARAVLGCFVRTLRWIQGTIFHIEALVGFDEGDRWVISLLYLGQESFQC